MKTLTLQDVLVKPHPVEINTSEGTLKVWIRNLSQIERDLAQAGARAASRQFRKVLENPKTEDHKLLIADEIEEYGEDRLRDLWIQTRLVERAIKINKQTLEDRDKTFVPEPEGDFVTMGDIERYENEVEEIEEQRENSVMSAINAAREQLEKEAKKIPLKDLKASAIPDLIDNILGQYWQKEFAYHMLARGTFKDEKCTKPFFKTAQEASMLQPTILEALSNAHFGLILEPEALKTSGGAEK